MKVVMELRPPKNRLVPQDICHSIKYKITSPEGIELNLTLPTLINLAAGCSLAWLAEIRFPGRSLEVMIVDVTRLFV
jgi:hypothetical protein